MNPTVTLPYILGGLAALAVLCLLAIATCAALRCSLCGRAGTHRRDCLLRDL